MVAGQGAKGGRAQVRAVRGRGDAGHAGWLAGAALALAAVIAPAGALRAEAVIVSHGITTFNGDDLKLPADFPHLPYVNPEAPKGGEISLPAVLAGFDSLNPFSVQGRAAQGSSMMLESILTGTADEIGASYCFMCTTMEYPPDRSWVVFNLREDVTFSDGTPLTSEDVVFSYETFLNKGLSDFRTVLAQQVESAEALGPHKVKFTFREGVPTRDLPATVGGLPILSKAHYEANGLDLEESSLVPFLGTGAYVPQPVKSGTSVSYRRNPDYWAQDLPFRLGMNNYDVIRYEYFAEPSSALEAFKGGAYTFRQESVAKQWAEQYDFPAVKNGTVKTEALPLGTKANGQSWVFNLRREAWQDRRVREAIALMFNFEWSNQTLFHGAYDRIDSFWENSWLAAEGPPAPEEAAILKPLIDEGLLPETILTDPPVMSAVSRPERQLDRGNLRKASALLDEAGWEPGADGMRRNAKGEVLRIEFLEDNPNFERVVAPFVENLRAIGIDASLNLIDSAQYEVRTRNPAYDFDIIGSFTQTDYFSGAELRQFYGSETADISVFNAAGLKSPAVDRLIGVVMAADSMEELTTATHALDRVLRYEQFRIPMWYKAENWFAYYDMYEHPEELPPYSTGELSWWWVNPDKAAALKASGALRQ